ncbi:hypothetical protein [Amycolatopsis palatopharyngis]|uniref:hypothetical protein n=1 Tax=Amycolatopsis palatopharyngis TaxID=187982 RepID=UPI000E223426|nr:hypothetical protein [Amycolatopsis palatopharyngis]
MVTTTLIAVHAGAGILGLLTGPVTMRPDVPPGPLRWLSRIYLASLAVLLVSMVALIAVDWTGLDIGARLAFTGLAGLGAVIVYRIVQAGRESARRLPGWQRRYVAHVYFTYVSLWIGFLVLPALNLPLPYIAVPAVVLLVLAVGHVLVTGYQKRLVIEP